MREPEYDSNANQRGITEGEYQAQEARERGTSVNKTFTHVDKCEGNGNEVWSGDGSCHSCIRRVDFPVIGSKCNSCMLGEMNHYQYVGTPKRDLKNKSGDIEPPANKTRTQRGY